MKTIDKIITNVLTARGAPMGRRNIGIKPRNKKIYDCFVPMCSCCGAYDKGGAYWGAPIHGIERLRVSYTKDLTYIRFYRSNEKKTINRPSNTRD